MNPCLYPLVQTSSASSIRGMLLTLPALLSRSMHQAPLLQAPATEKTRTLHHRLDGLVYLVPIISAHRLLGVQGTDAH